MTDVITKAVKDNIAEYRKKYLKEKYLNSLDKIEEVIKMRGSLHILYVLHIVNKYPIKNEKGQKLLDVYNSI